MQQVSRPREPAFNVAWPALVAPVVIVVCYALQSSVGDPETTAAAFGFRAAALTSGQWPGVLTALFVHWGWAHAGLNALGALAFGAPVARRIGVRGLGPVIFFGFYLACGVIANLGFALVHPHGVGVLAGASGAVYGLIGAVSRLRGSKGPPGAVAPLRSPSVIGFALAWIVVNVLTALFGAPGLPAQQPIAWEAHLFGYGAGLVLIGPLLWKRPPASD